MAVVMVAACWWRLQQSGGCLALAVEAWWQQSQLGSGGGFWLMEARLVSRQLGRGGGGIVRGYLLAAAVAWRLRRLKHSGCGVHLAVVAAASLWQCHHGGVSGGGGQR